MRMTSRRAATCIPVAFVLLVAQNAYAEFTPYCSTAPIPFGFDTHGSQLGVQHANGTNVNNYLNYPWYLNANYFVNSLTMSGTAFSLETNYDFFTTEAFYSGSTVTNTYTGTIASPSIQITPADWELYGARLRLTTDYSNVSPGITLGTITPSCKFMGVVRSAPIHVGEMQVGVLTATNDTVYY
jgi:hypothetical protein